jgi:phosphoribosylaminoimidazole-succinocarboxamide synthase
MMAQKSIEPLISTNFFFKDQVDFMRGKVRDVYRIKDDYVAMVSSDRISAFDQVLPRAIPYKGQVLNQLAGTFLKMTDHIVPNWMIAQPDPHVTVGRFCQPFTVEFVVRGCLSGHSWRLYSDGIREICGNRLPDGLKENDALPNPILTPTTKVEKGHDEDISITEIISQKLITKKRMEQLEHYALELFKFGQEFASSRNLILVDTKYEFGLRDNKIYLIDEIHTPDSSRYLIKDSYDEIQRKNQKQKQLSKEFVRKWLMENGFQGKEGQSVPPMTDDFVNTVSDRYIELFENITGQGFVKRDYADIQNTIEDNVNNFIQNI